MLRAQKYVAYFVYARMFPRFLFKSIPFSRFHNTFVISMQSQKHITASSINMAAGIEIADIANLPSGLLRKDEKINGEQMFSVQEGMAKIFFPASSPEDVFYNPGKEQKRGYLAIIDGGRGEN